MAHLPNRILGQPSLVAYWRLGYVDVNFNAFAKDLGPNKLHGSMRGSASVGTGPPLSPKDRLAQSASFPGANADYITVPHNSALSLLGDLTFLAIVNPTDYTQYRMLICKGITTNQAPYEWRMEITNGRPTLIIGNGVTQPAFVGTTAPPTGVVSMIGVTLSGSTVTHYLNGVANGSGAIAAVVPSDAGNPLGIGQRPTDPNYPFKGLGQDIAMFNVALPASEMLAFAVDGGFA